jgi:phospholipase A1/A2
MVKSRAKHLLLAFSVTALSLSSAAASDDQLVVSSHEPAYFIIGHNEFTSARFQFSFKYKLFDLDSVPAQILAPLNGLHLAYTQTSVWDLSAESKPFHDNSYRPAFLYQWEDSELAAGQPAWRLQGGFEHESNGRDETRSRSINILFIHPTRRFAMGSSRFLEVGARLYAYTDREENPDIVRYRGVGDYQLAIGRIDGTQWRLTTRIGSSGHGSVQLDASYPFRRQYFANTGGYLYAQYFNGYGETLLDYNRRNPSQLRIGFAIVR